MSVETVLVNTKNGPVRGRKRVSSINNNHSTEFLGFQCIPYAKPPIGKLRFKAPIPIDNWTEPIEAVKQPPPAYARDLFTHQLDQLSSEDCLYLNVYTKDVRPPKLRPVMLFIHGGGFMCGSTDPSMYSPELLLRADIVFVSVAYRLGALGFLSIDDPKFGIPGNAGLKDQALGMRWVRDNIAAFGGDPQCITLFGESAGAASVHYHLLSGYSRGLFQRAILQSGTALSAWAQQPPDADLNERLARKLGWSGEGGVEGMMRVMCAASAADIVQHQHLERIVDMQRGVPFVFVPVVEPYGAETEECFLPHTPEEMALTAWGNSVPVLMGATSDECLFFYKQLKNNANVFEDDGYFVHGLPAALSGLSLARKQELAKRLMHAYYGDHRPSLANVDTFVRFLSDKYFWHNMRKTIRARSGGSAPTFLYRFSFDSRQPSFGELKMIMCGDAEVRGVAHLEELMYLFRFENVDYDLAEDSAELTVVRNMVNIWTTFAAHGNPNHRELGQEWKPVADGNATALKCLDVNEQLTFIDLPESKNLAIWDELENEV